MIFPTVIGKYWKQRTHKTTYAHPVNSKLHLIGIVSSINDAIAKTKAVTNYIDI